MLPHRPTAFDPDFEPEKSPSEPLSAPASPIDHHSQICPACGNRLVGHHCKLVCTQCGYYLSCTDYY